MWNSSVKQAYIASLPENKRQKAERLFKKLEAQEECISTDVADMNLDELTKAIESCNPQSYIMAFAMRRIILDYTAWRHEFLNLPDCNNAAKDFNPLSCCALDDTAQHFRNFDDVYKCLLSVYAPTDGMACYPIACFAWMGLTSEQIANLSSGDVDLNAKSVFVKSNAKAGAIECKNSLVIELLRIYQNTTIGKRTQNRNFYVNLVDVGKFLKLPRSKNSQKGNAPITSNKITHLLNTDFNAQYQRLYGKDTHLTYEGIRMLGKINRLEELVDQFEGIRSIPVDMLYEYTQFSKTNWTVPMIEATLTSFKAIHHI